jgi:hypothetical protein
MRALLCRWFGWHHDTIGDLISSEVVWCAYCGRVRRLPENRIMWNSNAAARAALREWWMKRNPDVGNGLVE